MFGLSLNKILFTVVALAVVWFAFKWLGRVKAHREAEARLPHRGGGGGSSASRGPVEDLLDRFGFGPKGTSETSRTEAATVEEMVKCPACSDYVAANRPTNCGRKDCPYPG
jgi:uncharacterized protein